jgi:hypothetical protein
MHTLDEKEAFEAMACFLTAWYERGHNEDSDLAMVLSNIEFMEDGGTSGSPDWVQPVVVAPVVQVVPPTRFGIDPLRDDLSGEYRCPLGHRPELNILSEVHVDRTTWRGDDMVKTEQVVGDRRGVLVPTPLVLVSQRFYQRLRDAKMRGFTVEVAHLI